MYSRYISGTFAPVNGSEQKSTAPSEKKLEQHRPTKITADASKLLGNIIKQFSIEKLDAGDILLILIIFFLFIEGDNLDMVITLGLMLLFTLNESD